MKWPIKIPSSIKNSAYWDTLSHSKNYLSIAFANEGLKFISIPVLTYLLSTSDYGILNIFASWVAILTVLIVFNLNGAISRYFYEYSKDFGHFLGFSLAITGVVFAISSFLILLFRETLARWMELPDMVIFFLLPAILFEVINSCFRQVYQPLKDSRRIRKYSIGSVYLTFALTVIFILLREDDKYIGRLQSLVVVSGIYSIFKVRDIFKFVKFGVRKRFISYIAKFSLPNIPYLLSGTILSQIDRIIISHHMGSSEAGLYSFAYNIGTLQLMASNAIHNAWVPKYYEHMRDNNEQKIQKDTVFFSKLIALASCGLILFGMELGKLLSASSYHSSLFLIPWIVFGHFFVGISPFNKNYIIYTKKTYITAAITLTAGLVNLGLNLWLIPIYGSIAAAYTTLFSYFLLFSMEFIISRYILKFQTLEIKLFALPTMVVAACGLTYLFYFQNTEMSIIDIFLKLIFCALLAVVLFFKKLKTLKT